MTTDSIHTSNYHNDQVNENAGESAQQSQHNSETLNHDNSAAIPCASGPHSRKLFLVNRVTYFGFAISLLAFVVDFFLGKDGSSEGITLDIVYGMMGILLCASFVVILGPMFSLLASVLRILDVFPALGSSLWVLLSIRLTVAVVNDPLKDGAAFFRTLPFFGLIMANGIAFLLNVQLEEFSDSVSDSPLFNNNSWLMFAIRHSFEDGKHSVNSSTAGTNDSSLASIPGLSVTQSFTTAYQNIRDKSVIYLHGQVLDEFFTSFETWRTESRKIRLLLLLRRLFFLVGYLIETAALFFSFALLKYIRWHVSSPEDGIDFSIESFELRLPIWQICLVVILSLFSHYLWVFIGVEATCTSSAEVSSVILLRMDSWTNWAESGFWNIAKRWSCFSEADGGDFHAGELPTIGIVADDAALESGKRILRQHDRGSQVYGQENRNEYDTFVSSSRR